MGRIYSVYAGCDDQRASNTITAKQEKEINKFYGILVKNHLIKQNLHRLVRFLYIIRYPHSRQRIASLGRISFSQ